MKQLTPYPIALGIGDFFWNAEITRDSKIDLIKFALDLGINLIDTAEGYGDSEALVGAAISKKHSKVMLATKVSPENLSYEKVIESCYKSLENLKVDYIDIYQIHWPNPSVPFQETLDAFVYLYERKLIKNIGLCNYTLSDLQFANKYLGTAPFTSIQTEYNLHERSIEKNGLLEFCIQNNTKILAYSPLDQGQYHLIDPYKKSVLIEISDKHKVSIQQLILAFLMRIHGLIAIIRTTSKEHLIENARSTQIKLSSEEVDRLENVFPIKIWHIPTDKIKVSVDGEWNHEVYQTLEEALNNRLGFTPSPKELAKTITNGELLKPVRLRPSSDGEQYDLVAGRIRYWAWVIAHLPDVTNIPAYIRDR